MFEFKWRNIPITLKIYCPLGLTVVFHSKNLIGCDEQPLPRIRKAHTRSMRGHRSKSLASLGVHHNTITRAGACNSLCSKTLPLSPLFQYFTRVQQEYLGPNWCVFNILRKQCEKNNRIMSSFQTDEPVLTRISSTARTASHYMLASGSPVSVQSRRESIP